jgi:flagellar motility protein MotE (MotC chaperone)
VAPAASEAERALLVDLRRRRVELDAREAALTARNAMLEATEKRLAARVDELASLQTKLEALERARRDRDEANWVGMVKLYETMKPREAALIFNDLEMPILLQVVDRMKEAKAAQVLAAMQPERARLVTSQLAQLRSRANAPPGQPKAGG